MKSAIFALLFSMAAWTAVAEQSQPRHSQAKQHVITKGDLTIIHDCHVIYLDAEDELQRERDESADGRARLEKPQHSTAYDCYTTENPVYRTLVDLDVHDKLSEEGKKLLDLVLDDISYFQLSLDRDEK